MIYIPIPLEDIRGGKLQWIRDNVQRTDYKLRVHRKHCNFYAGVHMNEQDALFFMIKFGITMQNGRVVFNEFAE
jgi:hypothetical protein